MSCCTRDSRPDAFEKMFERDKDELRSLGVPVDVATIDPLFEDEVGYRIPPEAFALPDVELTPEEAAVVGLASRVWQHADHGAGDVATPSGEAVRGRHRGRPRRPRHRSAAAHRGGARTSRSAGSPVCERDRDRVRRTGAPARTRR